MANFGAGSCALLSVRDLCLLRREFVSADTDGDGVLSLAEFIEAGTRQPQLARYFESLARLTATL